MDPNDIRRLFPNASSDLLAVNTAVSDTGAQRHKKKPLARTGEGKAPSVRRPHVRFTLRRVNLLDVDAKYASVKDVLDGLQHASIIHGDREDQITLEVIQEKVSSRKEETTGVEILIP